MPRRSSKPFAMVRSGLTLVVSILVVFRAVDVCVGQTGEPLAKPEAVPVYQPGLLPFEAGEKAVYRATWNGIISVATAEVEAMPTVVHGKKAYLVRVEARSSKPLDLIWKMRDTITSTFEASGLLPSRYTFKQRENSRVIDTDARLDSASKRWAVDRRQVGKKPRMYEFESQNTLDPITAVYLARSIDFRVGDRLYFKIFGGRYRYLLELYVEKRERVELSTGAIIEAFRIIPRVQNIDKKGYASRFNDGTIWISADERRLPIKLSAKIVFGAVHVELIMDNRAQQSTSAEARPGAS